MKKTLKNLVVFAGSMSLAIGAMANVNLTWGAGGGFFSDNAGNSTASGFMTTLGLSGAYVELIYAGADNTINAPTAGGGVSGDDTILKQGAIPTTTGGDAFPGYGDFLYSSQAGLSAFNPGSTFNGDVYVRIFGAATSGGIAGGNGTTTGTLFWSGPLKVITDGGATPTPVFVDANTAAGDNTGNFMSSRVVAAVPEPATFAFMGMGGLLLAIRRFRRSEISVQVNPV